MKDIISQYKKHTFFQTSLIVVTSLAFAFGINVLFLDGNMSQYLKASVLDINGAEQTADIYGKVSPQKDTIILGTQKPMSEVTNISLSLIYDPEQSILGDISPLLGESEIISLAKDPGVHTLMITFSEPKTFSEETDFLKVSIKKQIEKTSQLNIINANFRDAQEKEYLLSTSGILY